MTIGANNNFCANRQLNPYITDGLIGMWDGENNIGIGKHSNDTAIWHDLTENHFDLECNATPEWTENATLIENSKKNCWYRYNTDVLTIICKGDECTIEVVYNGIGDNYIAHRGLFGLHYSSTVGILMQATYGSAIDIGVNGDAFNSLDRTQFYLQTKQSLSYSRKCNFKKNLYINGQMYVTGNSSGYKPQTKDFSIGCSNDVQGHSQDRIFTGNIYCFRLYNRQLSQEEVAFNYAIDKTRFGM